MSAGVAGSEGAQAQQTDMSSLMNALSRLQHIATSSSAGGQSAGTGVPNA